MARPDLRVVLVEPLARRIAFLMEAVESLGLTGVEVIRGRAEECVGQLGPADVVTARAVAPLDRLSAWALPLAAIGGRLLAIKGASAAAEAVEHAESVMRLGGGRPTVRECGAGLVSPATSVIEVVRERSCVAARPRRKGHGSTRR